MLAYGDLEGEGCSSVVVSTLASAVAGPDLGSLVVAGVDSVTLTEGVLLGVTSTETSGLFCEGGGGGSETEVTEGTELVSSVEGGGGAEEVTTPSTGKKKGRSVHAF